ncbi:MAG: DUF3492 domain-containing protein, partial [Phycisphaeraceae bacterium]|nr:DUF3492 domain-containing protein [Phycisphaeraceae bacterium]
VSPKRGFYEKGPVYQMPENVVDLDEVYLHDYALPDHRHSEGMREKVERFRDLVNDMRDGRIEAFPDFLETLESESADGLDALDLLQSVESWDVLTETYRAEASDESFLNFFWTWRYAYMPLFNILEAKSKDARLYHTISTGYAGLLAAAGGLRRNRPMILTEHGIYTKERRIEINRADWIEDWESGEVVAERRAPYFKRYWIRQFQMMSRICYEYADEIFTLYEGNTHMQIRDGADPEKLRIVPNGIDLGRFGAAAEAKEARPPNERYTVGFVGRVCPIKDIKTLIYASRLVAEEVPDVLVRVLGP